MRGFKTLVQANVIRPTPRSLPRLAIRGLRVMFAATALCTAYGQAVAGTMSPRECFGGENFCNYKFAGPITMRDVSSFKQIVRGKYATAIYMDSDGGDVRAAIEIGRHLQEIMADVVVNEPARCASACVIILGAAPKRKAHDERTIGIHRLYTTSTGGTFAERQTDFEQIGSEVKTLFRRSGVRESLWDDMQRVPPETLKWLTRGEIRDYGLTGNSPAANDQGDAELAQRIGISKTELLRRKAEADRDCPKPTSLDDPNLVQAVACNRNIIWGRR